MSYSYFAAPTRVWSLAALPAFLFVANGSATARGHSWADRTAARAARLPALGLRYSFTTRSSTTGGDGSERDQLMLAGTGQVLGANARLDVTDAASVFLLKKGNYVLVKGESATLTIVDASARNYYELSAADIGQGMAAFAGPAGALVRIDLSGVETRGETIGAGPTLSGYPTTQYRISQRYTMKMSIFGKKSTLTSTSTIDYFLAPSVTQDLVYPFADLGLAIGQSMPGNGMGELARQLLAEQRRLFSGAPMKTQTRTESVDDKGRRSVSTYTNEITNVERVAIDQSIFTIPASYTVAPSPVQSLAGAGSSGGSATANSQAAQGTRDSAGLPGQVGDAAKQGAAEGVKDGVRESAREAVTKKVRGMFRKP
jgi:hypothetical protein